MAIYSLLFGHAEGPPEPKPRHRVVAPRRASSDGEPVTVRLPASLKERVAASAALEGLSPDAWIVRALSRSIDPRLLAR